MNLILIEEQDLITPGLARLRGRRLRHIIDVHRASAGDELAVGMLGGRIGAGRITRISGDVVEMEVRLEHDPPAPLPVCVLLALPRPKVMRRVLFSLSVLGVKRIILINSARVEKSYWQSPFLHDAAVRRQFLLGLEQAGDTVLPEVRFRPLFKPFVEDELPGILAGTSGIVAHPSVRESFPTGVQGPVTLAIGPEGGFVPYELDRFLALGFRTASLGPRILNVETAVPSIISRFF